MNVTFVVEELLASNMIFLRVLSNATGNVEELGMNYGTLQYIISILTSYMLYV